MFKGRLRVVISTAGFTARALVQAEKNVVLVVAHGREL
jgi:hypothetical protein